MRRLVPALLTLCCSAVLATPAAAAPAEFGVVTARGEFGSTAFTYQPSLVPVGARASVFSLSAPAYGTGVTLVVHGLVPGRDYGAHAHTKPCGPDGAAAGPHYQKRVDPVSPSVDPAYANPSNEIWLDLTTDRFGTGFSTTRVPWQFDAARRAGSVVLHETHTHTHPGHAGTAGARLACLTVPF
ncbi:superoxide dismutase family protein [Amycolatopsis sp. YIM 10]|uniref:superoxide dismutase family protein n=1 Tax=Amycolatopsis sp. YIM 10 TaxID=2653857 RepID=UPI0012905ED3|nr:superoxide dismutase family protein [Amycolatopsis sp. YIM 10]QFU94349.1 Copper/zinc superoxide dismutase (SODC) [Amycolatopsis sp. YIM 10]